MQSAQGQQHEVGSMTTGIMSVVLIGLAIWFAIDEHPRKETESERRRRYGYDRD